MKVCVLGSGGLLGHMLIRILSESHDVYGTTRGKASKDSLLARFLPLEKWIGEVDAMEPSSIESVFEKSQFDVVINCIGLIKQRSDQVDDRLMMTINGEFPHQLAKFANSSGARVIQISTDCVFSGNKGNYVETDTPDPVDTYGRSKLLGELNDSTNLTIRTSHIGRELSVKKSFVEWLLSQRNGRISGFSGAIYSGLTTKELAKVIGNLVPTETGLSGLFHVSSEAISKLEIIIKLNELLDLNIEVIEDETVRINRSLNSHRFQTATNIFAPKWDLMLKELCADQATYV
jgi:dTDP-4-dehydrorhamnose reductase